MSNNIRDFRNAGQSSDEAEKSNTGFYALVLAIPVIAVIAGLGYRPMMEMRGKSVGAIQQAEADIEAKRRAENPLYALMNAPKNADGLIDPNKPISFGRAPSPEAAAARKLRNDYARKALTAKEFLGRVDAKAHNFSPLDMETLKYERAAKALGKCKNWDLRAYYLRQNKASYEKLKTIKHEAKAAKDAAMAATYSKQAEKAEKHFNQMKNIETKGQALAFVASGGAGRHMDVVGGQFGAMSSLIGDSAAFKVRSRNQGFSKRECSRVQTIIQSGQMKIKTNVRVK